MDYIRCSIQYVLRIFNDFPTDIPNPMNVAACSLWEPIGRSVQTTMAPPYSFKPMNLYEFVWISLYAFIIRRIIIAVIRQCMNTIWRKEIGESGAIVAPLCGIPGLPFVWDSKRFLRTPVWGTRAKNNRATDHVVTYLRRIPALGKQTWIKGIMHVTFLVAIVTGCYWDYEDHSSEGKLQACVW
jgi:hypothetical protein